MRFFVKYQQIYARCLPCIKQVGICCQLAVSLKARIGDQGIGHEGSGMKDRGGSMCIFFGIFSIMNFYTYQQRMLLKRTMTMDAAAMHQKLNKTRIRTSSSSVEEGSENLGDITERTESSNKAKEALPVAAATNEGSTEELNKLREELGEVKNQLVDLTQVKNFFIAVLD